MKLTFCGAQKRVTGSCYLLETSTTKILVDCGMIQGSRVGEQLNFEPFPFDPSKIDIVLITHAHLDHTGRIPKLVREGFSGRIIATAATNNLAKLIMEDSTRILASEAQRHDHAPLYTEEDFARTEPLFEDAEYHTPLRVDDNVSIEFFDAGHILGSSSIRITDGDTSIVFSGDLGNPPVPLLRATDHIDAADYVVMESTYGGRVHEDKETRTLLLKSIIYETVQMKGVLMIPAFAMERTQELLYELNTLVNEKHIPPVPIFLDSPLAIKATRVFQESEVYFNKETQDMIKSGDDVFDFPGLKMTLETDESKAIANFPAPKVIIAGSGMAHGGRILHHIKKYISNFANTYLIVGYQVQGTLGRQILDGKKKIKVHGEEFDVKAKVKAIGGYSAHGDQPKLTEWVSSFDRKRLKKVFITHGEEDQADALQRHLQQSLDAEIIVPTELDSVEL